jgi:hypothetical protein
MGPGRGFGLLAISTRFCDKNARSILIASFTVPFWRAATMPYFVYKVSPKLQLTYIDTKERYQDARTLVRDLRARDSSGEPGEFRLIFANQQGEAEKLLSTPRDERVIGED